MKKGDINKHTFIVHNEKGGSYSNMEKKVKTLARSPNVVVIFFSDMCRKAIEVDTEKGTYTVEPKNGQLHIVFACQEGTPALNASGDSDLSRLTQAFVNLLEANRDVMLPRDIGTTWEEVSGYADIRSFGYKAANNFNINPSELTKKP